MEINYALTFLLLCISCLPEGVRPLTKERYLYDYHRFCINVEKQYPSFTPKDWQHSNAMYTLYSDEWYVYFKNDLSPQEKSVVTMLGLNYHCIKLKAVGKSISKKMEEWLLDTENSIVK